MRGGPEGEFGFPIYTAMVERLTELIFSLPHLVEWDVMDSVSVAALREYSSYVSTGSIQNMETTNRWRSFVISVLR